MDRRADLAIGALLAIGLHGAVIGAIGRWDRPGSFRAGEPRAASAASVVVLAPELARALVQPGVVPRGPRLREPRSAPHPQEASAPSPAPARSAAPLDPPPLLADAPTGLPLLPAERPEPAQRLAPPPRPAPRPDTERDVGEASAEAPGEEAEREGAPGATPDLAAAAELVAHRPPLDYPERARRRGIEGAVRVGLEVGAGGSVARAWVERSSGSRALDRAALDNVRGWTFHPDAVRLAGLGWVFHQDVRFSLR